MKISISNFNALIPKLEDVNLPPSCASTALDVDIASGSLRPALSTPDSVNPITHTPVKIAIPNIPTLAVEDLFNPLTQFSFQLTDGTTTVSLLPTNSIYTNQGIIITTTGWSTLAKSIYNNITSLTIRNGTDIQIAKLNLLYKVSCLITYNGGNCVPWGNQGAIGYNKTWGAADYSSEILDTTGYPIASINSVYALVGNGGAFTNVPTQLNQNGVTYPLSDTQQLLIAINYMTSFSQYAYYRITAENTFSDGTVRQGPPSDISSPITRKKSQLVKITFNGLASSGTALPTKYHIYRAANGTGIDKFHHIAEVAYGTAYYEDQVASNDILGYSLPIYHGTEPPTALWGNRPEGLTKVILTPTDYYVGYINKTLWFSGLREQNHMFPVAYSIILDYNIIDIYSLGSGVVVLTDYGAYIVWGQQTYEHWNQLVSDLGTYTTSSAVKINDVLYYVSQNGIVRIAGSRADIVTINYFTPEQFKLLNPATIRLDTANDMLYMFCDTENYYFDFQNNRTDVINITATSTNFTATSYTWRSKKFKFDQPVAFKIGRVLAESYINAIFKLYANGVLVFTKTVTSDKPFRLERLEEKRYWEVEVISSDTIHSISIAQNEEEFHETQ